MLAQSLDIPNYVYDKALDVMDAFSKVKNDRIAVTDALIPYPLKDCAEFLTMFLSLNIIIMIHLKIAEPLYTALISSWKTLLVSLL